MSERRYTGFFLHHALACMRAGYPQNAASWMMRDDSPAYEEEPAVDSLRIVQDEFWGECVAYRTVAESLAGVSGDGI